MLNDSIRGRAVLVAALLCASFVASVGAHAAPQRNGDYLSEGELETVRDVQEIHHRTEVFLLIADRRLAVLANPSAEPDGRLSKHMGPLRTGTQAELLDDYRRALDELMVKLEDEFERKGLSENLKKALELTIERTEKQMKQLETLKPSLTSGGATQFAVKAMSVAQELREGARTALAAK